MRAKGKRPAQEMEDLLFLDKDDDVVAPGALIRCLDYLQEESRRAGFTLEPTLIGAAALSVAQEAGLSSGPSHVHRSVPADD